AAGPEVGRARGIDGLCDAAPAHGGAGGVRAAACELVRGHGERTVEPLWRLPRGGGSRATACCRGAGWRCRRLELLALARVAAHLLQPVRRRATRPAGCKPVCSRPGKSTGLV